LFTLGVKGFSPRDCCPISARCWNRLIRRLRLCTGRRDALSFGDSAGHGHRSAAFALPKPAEIRVRIFQGRAKRIVGFCLMRVHSGGFGNRARPSVAGITKGGAPAATATDSGNQGATYADGIGSAVCGHLWWLPKHIVSAQNVGLIRVWTGVTEAAMFRHHRAVVPDRLVGARPKGGRRDP